MKNQRIFPGIILIRLWNFFFWQQAKISLFAEYITWPSLLMIVGIAFFAKDMEGKNMIILPGVILTGFGFHFHIVNRLSIWPDHWESLLFSLLSAFYFAIKRLGTNGLFQGILFLALAGLNAFL